MSEIAPAYNSICGVCHAALGALIILAAVAAYPKPWLGPLLLLIYTTAKEYVYDILVEHDGLGWKNADGVSASLQDFTFYWVGGTIGMLFLWLVSLRG